MDLFHFDDDFIAAAACGMNDEDTLELFAEAIRAGADVLQERLVRSVGPDIVDRVRFVDGAFEIPLTQAQYDAEYGAGGGSPRANVRRAIIAASGPGSQEMGKVLDAD